MVLSRVVIGVMLNKRLFRLSSIGGLVIDALLDLETKKGHPFFSEIGYTGSKENDYTISLRGQDGRYSLTITQDQFILKKTSLDENPVNIPNVISDFDVFWKAANKIISFPSIRRIGFVGEHQIDLDEKKRNEMMQKFVTFSVPDYLGKFQLTFENRRLTTSGDIADKLVDDFWNTIYTIYLSEQDETPTENKLNINIDVQRYYNPAKTDPIKEINNIKAKYIEDKDQFIANFDLSGLGK
ncbi:hypothetical protein WCX49_02395 [Sulfurimonas sp. HSL-1656]|uniref:hypothetical protein n=1 Tax=Thiomicrolovo subterrani TaxID=3131934 RepID=UPI0031F8B894